MSPELYAYLDGIHVTHINQNPDEFKGVGAGLQEIDGFARKNNRPFLMLACGRSAAARGYNTCDDGKGTIVSLVLLNHAKSVF